MSSTGIKEGYFDYALFYNNFTCVSDINCSGLSIYNSIINSSSNLSNLQSTSTSIFNNLNSLSTIST